METHTVRRQIGPHSRLFNNGIIERCIDGRSTEGRFVRKLHDELVAHVGGNPSAPQRLIIHRVCSAALRLQLFDEKLVAGGFTDHDGRVYGALHNSLRLMLGELGIERASVKANKLSIREHLLAREAAEAEARKVATG